MKYQESFYQSGEAHSTWLDIQRVWSKNRAVIDQNQRTVIDTSMQHSFDSIPSDQERYNEERTIISCTKIFPKQIEETGLSIELKRYKQH